MGRNRALDDCAAQIGEKSPAGCFIGLHIRFAAPLLTYQTFPPEWIDHYTQNAYALRDPILAWGISQSGATRWSAVQLPDTFGIMARAASFGLGYGVCISCGEITSRTICSVARNDREFSDCEISYISQLVVKMHSLSRPPSTLTNAEIEALRVLASGARYAEGASSLGISESALKGRLSSARKKLFARTSAEAMQRAKEYRLI